jgi:hypothetical protein
MKVSIFSFLALLSTGCSMQQPKGKQLSLTSQQKVMAFQQAKKVFDLRFPDGKTSQYEATPVSYYYFWSGPYPVAVCPSKKDYIQKMKATASPNDSLILVKANHKEKGKADSVDHPVELYLDLNYRIVQFDCDSGIVYKTME